MSTQETKEYFIPGNIIELHTMPEDTIYHKLQRLIKEMLTKEEGIEPPKILILNYVFDKHKIGYDVSSRITWR